MTTSEFMAAGLLAFGLFALVAMGVLVKLGQDLREVTRSVGVLSILLSACFLVISDATKDHLAPVVGLLGTIAGFLLGKETSGRDTGDEGTSTTEVASTEPLGTDSPDSTSAADNSPIAEGVDRRPTSDTEPPVAKGKNK